MEKSLLTVIIALLISIIALTLSIWQREEFKDISNLITSIPQLSTENYFKVESVETTLEPPTIILYSNCYKLVGFVEDVQVRSINNALQKIREFRPNTHDFASDVFNEFNIRLIDVRIEEIKNNAYIAKAFVMQGNKIREIDIRPSDGIAMALRLNSPIYIKKDLMLSAGEKIC
ncbi:MAG: DUF151 domain-containing protein [Candidatus Aenigmatarchaeota archaeon]